MIVEVINERRIEMSGIILWNRSTCLCWAFLNCMLPFCRTSITVYRELESCLLESIPPRIFEMKGLTTLYVYALKQIDLLNWKNDIRKLNDNPMGDVMVNSEQYQFLRDLPSLFVNFKSAESCEGGEIRSLPALGLAQPTLICVHPDAQVAPPLPERIGIEDSLSA